MRRSTSTSEPLCSPARTMLTYKSEKIRGCRAMASDKPRPSVTSCFKSRLTSAGMPLDSRCVMLFSATASGMPELSRLASCWVKVASSCNFGLRLRSSKLRDARRQTVHQDGHAAPVWTVRRRRRTAAAPALAASTAIGKSPSRSICASAAGRSGNFQNALHHFAAAAAGLIRKLRHSLRCKNRCRTKVSCDSRPQSPFSRDTVCRLRATTPSPPGRR